MNTYELHNALKANYSDGFTEPVLLREGGSVTYSAWLDGKKYLVKLIPSSFIRTAERAARLIGFLQNRGVSIPRLLPSRDSELYIKTGDKLIEVFDYLEGTEPQPGDDPELIGETVGQLHTAMAAYDGELTVNGRDFYFDRYLRLLRQKNCGDKLYEAYEKRASILWERLSELPTGVSHGDLYIGNLFLAGGKYYILDFDTACRGFLMHDVMAVCNCTDYMHYKKADFEQSAVTYEKFLTSYQRYRILNTTELSSFFDMIALYHYQIQATILEVNGLDCVDLKFVEWQNQWLDKLEQDNILWKKNC